MQEVHNLKQVNIQNKIYDLLLKQKNLIYLIIIYHVKRKFKTNEILLIYNTEKDNKIVDVKFINKETNEKNEMFEEIYSIDSIPLNLSPPFLIVKKEDYKPMLQIQ